MGNEALRLQSIYLAEDVADRYSDALLLDLAGNAFNASTAMVGIIALLIVVARTHFAQYECNRGSLSANRNPRCARSLLLDMIASDSDSE